MQADSPGTQDQTMGDDSDNQVLSKNDSEGQVSILNDVSSSPSTEANESQEKGGKSNEEQNDDSRKTVEPEELSSQDSGGKVSLDVQNSDVTSSEPQAAIQPSHNSQTLEETVNNLWEHLNKEFKNNQDGVRKKYDIPNEDQIKEQLKADNKSGESWNTNEMKWSDCGKNERKKATGEKFCGYMDFSLGSSNYKMRLSFVNGNPGKWKLGWVKKDGENGQDFNWQLSSWNQNNYPWNSFTHNAAKGKSGPWSNISYLDGKDIYDS